MSQPDSANRPWWLGFAVIFMGALWIWGALQLTIGDRLSGLGPGAFVLIVGVGLVILGAILLLQIARGERFEAEDSEDASADAPVSYPSLAMAGTAVFLPAVAMGTIGFPITAAISYTLIARTLGARNLLFNFAIGIVLSSLCWYGFSKLGVQLAGYFPLLGV